jgi:hypothetical protein
MPSVGTCCACQTVSGCYSRRGDAYRSAAFKTKPVAGRQRPPESSGGTLAEENRLLVAIWLPYTESEAHDLHALTNAESTKSNVFNRTRTWVELYESAALTAELQARTAYNILYLNDLLEIRALKLALLTLLGALTLRPKDSWGRCHVSRA